MEELSKVLRWALWVWLAGQVLALAGLAAVLWMFWRLLGEATSWFLAL